MRITEFDPCEADRVLSWAQTPTELDSWASLAEAPSAAIFQQWLEGPDSHGRLLINEHPIAYGELWVSEEEDEVEIGHLIVSPACRNTGIGREFVRLLVEESRRFSISSAWVRVVPDNEAALRCYAAAGFSAASADQQARFNSIQPRSYTWLRSKL